MRELARAAWPHEACGLLLQPGPDARAGRMRVHPCPNLAGDPGRGYEIDPETFLRLDRVARYHGGAIIGVWHSHPHGDPRPSARDAAEAWPGWSYLIIGVTATTVSAPAAWWREHHQWLEQPVDVVRTAVDDADFEIAR